jgi:uncharacterized protein (TIGR02217 family)
MTEWVIDTTGVTADSVINVAVGTLGNSSYVYPVLPGLTLDVVRSPEYNTGITQALSGKESRIAYRQYPLMTWQLQYDLLRDYVSPSDLKALVGLFMAVQGRFNSFLYLDPLFNAVTQQQFAVIGASDTAGAGGTRYQAIAVYGNSGGPGGNEMIQNFSGTPQIYGNSSLISSANYALDGDGGVTFNTGDLPASGTVLTWSGSFYYRVRFDGDDVLEFTQFMQAFWELKRVKLRQILL